ncbi:ankyrin repeat domain-containing protein [Paenibacillus xylanexedens]|uniref:ankyrin repeat domain-containing protein n=1 Tax=Paenibacillus xylanexedens TaxID=528191 RepID=UPI0011A25A10|nr:ankyrin repeat domain-containing protein [Paenibacillus xylanexedens]
MAKKKKTTLPADIEKLIANNDIAAVKEVFEQCEWDARGGYSKGTALSLRKISDGLIRWLVEQGADVNAQDKYQRTPLHAHAAHWSGNVSLLLELGADPNAVDYQNETPLHAAFNSYRIQAVQELVNHGVDINVQNKRGNTPLAKGLINCRNADIVHMAEIATMLLDAGASVTPEMKESVKGIGKNFEFIREKYNKDSVDEVSGALLRLYQLFDVERVAVRIMHDGTTPIQVTATTWPKQHQELWEYLIPPQGYAPTVQGEVIRITGRVSHEVLDNGGGNWDADFRKMLDALVQHFGTGSPLTPALLQEANDLVIRLRKGSDYDAPARLCELAVQWVLANPQPVTMAQPAYSR